MESRMQSWSITRNVQTNTTGTVQVRACSLVSLFMDFSKSAHGIVAKNKTVAKSILCHQRLFKSSAI